MSVCATEMGVASTQWLRGLWEYYREYTHTAIHAASVAALTIFGLLVVIDPLFVVVAIASYLGPPVILYSIGTGAGTTSDSSKGTDVQADSRTNANHILDTDSDSDNGGSDSDSDDGDTDSDGTDTDTDTDGGYSDTDTDE